MKARDKDAAWTDEDVEVEDLSAINALHQLESCSIIQYTGKRSRLAYMAP